MIYYNIQYTGYSYMSVRVIIILSAIRCKTQLAALTYGYDARFNFLRKMIASSCMPLLDAKNSSCTKYSIVAVR